MQKIAAPNISKLWEEHKNNPDKFQPAQKQVIMMYQSLVLENGNLTHRSIIAACDAIETLFIVASVPKP